MARFAATTNAINKGLENLKPEKGVDLIEDWESAVAELDLPGAKGIARDLGALRKHSKRVSPTASASTRCSTDWAKRRSRLPNAPKNRAIRCANSARD